MPTPEHYQYIKDIYSPLGYKVRKNQEVHPKAKKFFATASNSSKIIAVDVIDDPVEIKQIGELYSLFRSSNMPVDLVVLANFDPVSAAFITTARKSGVGVIAVEGGIASLVSDPNYDMLILSDIKLRAFGAIESINFSSIKYGFKLFRNLKMIKRCLDEITSIPTTAKDTNNLLQSLSTIMDDIDVTQIKKTIKRNDVQGSLNNLKIFFNYIGKRAPNSISDLQAIHAARSTKFPNHSNMRDYHRAVRSLTGKNDPTEDELSKCCLNKFLNGLIEIRDTLKSP